MLSPIVKQRIEEKFGQQIRYPKDCDVLAATISAECNTRISGSTLKRLFGFIEGTNRPRLYTLDVIAHYIGCNNWDELVDDLAGTFGEKASLERVDCANLSPGCVLVLGLGLGKSLKIQHQEHLRFEVLDEVDSGLCVGDQVVIPRVILHRPVRAEIVTRGGEQVVLGEVTGVTSIADLSVGEGSQKE